MGRYPFQAALLGLVALWGCASVGAQTADEAITISRRAWYAICAGVCPDYDVTVWADGRVLAVRRRFDEIDDVERFRVTRDEASRFRALLDPLRPRVFRRTRATCDHRVEGGEAELLLRVTEIDIRWSTSGSRLVACDVAEDREIGEAIRAALRTIHLHVDANRM